MGLFSRRRDPIAVLDWLTNMRDVFLAEGTASLDRNPSAPEVLAYFSLSCSAHSACNTLHSDSKIADHIEMILPEFRCYYDSLWQLVLLSRANPQEESRAIQRLYALVDYSAEQIMQQVSDQNKNIKEIVKHSVSDNYRKKYGSIMVQYINVSMDAENRWTQVLKDQFITRLSPMLARDGSLTSALDEAMIQDTNSAMNVRMLTGFRVNTSLATLPGNAFQAMK